jgi:hypothetical protein
LIADAPEGLGNSGRPKVKGEQDPSARRGGQVVLTLEDDVARERRGVSDSNQR